MNRRRLRIETTIGKRGPAVRSFCIVLTVAAPFACGNGNPTESGMLATSTQAVQYSYVGLEGATNTGVNLLTASSHNSPRAKSVGSIRYPSYTTTQGNCGATFVSPTLAVTAGHCVDQPDFVVNSPITIEQYDTTGLNTSVLFNQAIVQGSWNGNGPGYDQYTGNFLRIGPGSGYRVTSLSCSVERNCKWGSSGNCKEANWGVDMAVIKCLSRAATDFVSPRSSAPPMNTAIEIRWFHEILWLATDTYSANPNQPSNNYQHYYEWVNGSQLNNYHYFYNPSIDNPQQLFPLLSSHNASNQLYQTTGTASNAKTGQINAYYQTITTNARICHGTSGSGVFMAGTDTFLGPALHGDMFNTTHLCEDISGTAVASEDFVDPAIVFSEMN